MIKYTWILLFLFSCQTKSTHVETTSDTAYTGEVTTTIEAPDSATLFAVPADTAPSDLAGTYVMEESRDCNIQISITKTAAGYSYEVKTSKRNVKGKLSFTKGEAREEMYINFLGFSGDNFTGDANKAANANEDEKIQSLEALYSDGALDIQNTGNAMNSYEKLAECSDKFIHLEKKK